MNGNIFRYIDEYLTKIEKTFVGIGILTITIFVFSGIITRYFLNFSPSWIEESAIYINLWIVFVGAGLCIKKEEHVNVDIIFRMLSKRGREILTGMLCFLSAIFIGFFGYYSFMLVIHVKETQQVSTAIDWLPMHIVYCSAVIGSILMIIEFFKMGISYLYKKYK